MGLFSSKKRTYVATSTVRLVEDVPNVLQKTTANVLMTDTPLIEGILDTYLTGVGANLNNYFNYGKNHYTRGLPEGEQDYTKPSEFNTQNAIQADIDSALLPFSGKVSLSAVYTDKCNTEFLVLQYLDENLGLNTATQEVANPPFTALGTVTYVDHSIVDSTTIAVEYLDAGDASTHIVNAPITNHQNSLYIHAQYFVKQSSQINGQIHFWSYQINSGRHIKLDKTTSYKSSQYFPIVPLREHNVNLGSGAKQGTELYQTSRKLMNRLNVSFDDLCSSIHENPDIADIDHAYFMVAANPQSTQETTHYYLYQYFKQIQLESLYTKADYLAYLAGDGRLLPRMNTLSIRDGQFDMSLNYLYIDVTQTTGSIGAVGATTRTNVILEPEKVTETVEYRSDGEDRTQRNYYDYEVSELVYRHQIDTNTYETVTVKGLLHINHVYNNHTVETTLAMSLDPDTNNLVIPLNHDITDTLNLIDRTQLAQESVILICNSYVVQKVKWYESTFFKFVLIVVAVVATAYTGYPALSAAMAAGTTATAIFIVKAIVLSYVAKLGFKFVADELGAEVAWILAAVLMVYGIAGTSTGTASNPGLPFAEEVLWTASGLNQGVTESIEEDLADAMDDFAELQESYTELMHEISETQDELTKDNLLTPAIFINPAETVDTYLERTIHSGNIGVKSLDLVTNYVSLQLELPK